MWQLRGPVQCDNKTSSGAIIKKMGQKAKAVSNYVIVIQAAHRL